MTPPPIVSKPVFWAVSIVASCSATGLVAQAAFDAAASLLAATRRGDQQEGLALVESNPEKRSDTGVFLSLIHI